jgi:hypothetical protein
MIFDEVSIPSYSMWEESQQFNEWNFDWNFVWIVLPIVLCQHKT